MHGSYVDRALAPYQPEIANILAFLRQERHVSEWQDWLWRRMPRFKAVTTRVPPHAPRIGRWGSAETPEKAVLYTDLLTLLVLRGDVVRNRGGATTTYVVRPLDIPVAPSYAQEDPF